MADLFPALDKRPIANTICLFDVDYTLTFPRRVSSLSCKSYPFACSSLSICEPPANLSFSQPATPEMLTLLSTLRQNVAIGYVSGSDFAKQREQLGTQEVPVTSLFDFCFAENGLTAYKYGVPLASQSFINWLGESKYKGLVKFILHYIADLDIPIKRGKFVEFRNGMMNVSPIGRNASIEERNEFERYDKVHKIRETFVGALQKGFAGLGLT